MYTLQGKKLLTFILAGGKGSRLYPLTRDRSKPAVPFAARFRIIDYVLSNCINSGLRQVYVLTQFKSLSLDHHLRHGWNFLANELSEFIQAVPAQQRVSEEWYSGTADAIFQNLHLLEDHRPDHVFILSGDHIYNMDFQEMYQSHLETNADLTIAVTPIKKTEASEFGVLTMNGENKIQSFIEKPQNPEEIEGEGEDCHINMGIYLFKTDALVRELAKDARETSSHDFGKNIIPNMLAEYNVTGFDFGSTKFGDYWKDVGTIRSYFEANMHYLDQTLKLKGHNDWKIRTMGEQLPSAFLGGDKGVELDHSTVGSGSYVINSSIKNSLIGRNVTIAEGCHIENSIISSDCTLEENCTIKNAILDQGVTISAGKTVGVDLDEDKRNLFLSDGIAVLPKYFEY